MAAPTPTTRQTPSGFKMPDGYQTLITFGKQPAIQFWEEQAKPPSIDGGEAIDTTTMHNVTWRTKAPRQLKTLEPIQVTAMYDPDVWNNANTLINDQDTITVKFPSADTVCFFGYCQKADFAELQEGQQPKVTLTIVPTNWDYVNNIEAGPVHTTAAGT